MTRCERCGVALHYPTSKTDAKRARGYDTRVVVRGWERSGEKLPRHRCRLTTWYTCGMLPGLVRVASVGRILGIPRATTRKAVQACGITTIRMPQLRSSPHSGPWYITHDDALRLLELLLPRALHARAHRRCRDGLAHEARLTATSGGAVRYHGADGVGVPHWAVPPETRPASHHTKISNLNQ